jgi:hypothetical protein
VTARERFKVGDRVKLSLYGRETFRRGRMLDRRATVVGFGRANHLDSIYIVSDGTSSREAYHHSLWEHADVCAQ